MTAVATIAFVAVTLRFLTRIPPLSIKWGADDWLVLAMVVRIPIARAPYSVTKLRSPVLIANPQQPIAAFFLASILKAVDLGFGQDIYMLTPRDVAEMTKVRFKPTWVTPELRAAGPKNRSAYMC